MTLIVALLTAATLFDAAAAAEPPSQPAPPEAAIAVPAPDCVVPDSLIEADSDLTHVADAVREHHRLEISVVGSGSSALPGPDGARFAYPARLEQMLKGLLPDVQVKVTVHVALRESTEQMAAGLAKVLADDKPNLVIWQAGTVDALRGVEPDEFRAKLESGLETITAAGADAIVMNMQYSPRIESMLNVSAYADVMHWVAHERGAVLFDRLAIMHYWTDAGIFDLYAATKDYAMARRVHDCIGRALASQIVNAAHLDAAKIQTTR
jgi:hypothetical protein